MPLKKYKLSKKSRKLKKSGKSSKSKKTKNYRSSRKLKQMFKKKNRSSSRNRSNLKSKKYQKGAGCNIATVQEPGFNIDTLGSMPGLSIAASTAAIYRPNCNKNSSSQAMVPS